MAFFTQALESYFQSIDLAVAATMGFVVFSLINVADRPQLGLFGASLTVSLRGKQWLLCTLVAVAFLLLDEVVKFFMRPLRRP